MHPVEFILYVQDQARARDFYATVLGTPPSLDVPGMTEFDLGHATVGLMPAHGMVELLNGQIELGVGPRCELYLRRADAHQALARAVQAGGRLLSEPLARTWGETVGYASDPDGHILAFAVATPGGPQAPG